MCWVLQNQSGVKCQNVLLLYICLIFYKKRQYSTHQSFTLVFLSFLRRTRGFQPCSNQTDTRLKMKCGKVEFKKKKDHLFFSIQTLILDYFREQ